MLIKKFKMICEFICMIFWVIILLMCISVLVMFLFVNMAIDKILIKMGYKGMYNDRIYERRHAKRK